MAIVTLGVVCVCIWCDISLLRELKVQENLWLETL